MPENRRRRSRRAIRLSETDQRRLAAGEINDPTEALHAPEVPHPAAAGNAPDGASTAVPGAQQPQGPAPSAEDERLLREVPPHFGPL